MTYHSVKTIKKFFGLCDWLVQTYEFRKFLFDDNQDVAVLRERRHEYFFYKINVIFQESWMHQLAKLHDPAVMGGNINLTLEYIVQFGGWEDDFRKELLDLKESMDFLYSSIKVARNKLLSHNDYRTMIGPDKALGKFDNDGDINYFNALKEFCEKLSQKVLNEPFVRDELMKNDIDCFMSQFIAGKI